MMNSKKRTVRKVTPRLRKNSKARRSASYTHDASDLEYWQEDLRKYEEYSSNLIRTTTVLPDRDDEPVVLIPIVWIGPAIHWVWSHIRRVFFGSLAGS